jgi:hypothetical protein
MFIKGQNADVIKVTTTLFDRKQMFFPGDSEWEK